MKVAIFVETYSPFVNGVVTHVHVLKDGLEKLGHEVLIVTADTKIRQHYIKDNVLHCPAIGIKKLYGYGLASPVSYIRMKYIRRFNPDIIHIQQEFGVGLFGVLAAKLLKKPLVYTLHTMYDEYIFYVAPKILLPLVKKVSHRYARFLAKRASALTGPSKKVEEFFKSCGVNKFVHLIPNSVELDEFDDSKITMEQKQAIRNKYNIPLDATVACFVGRMGNEKSIDVLLEFWAEKITTKDNLHLLIVGDGPNKADFEALTSKLDINSMVTFTGKIPHEELPPYYALSDAFVTASLTEMNSISMLEAMSSGLPVLQRYDRLNEDQISVGVNGFFFNNSEELANLLKGIAAKTPEERLETKRIVTSSINKSSAENLANYIVSVYSDFANTDVTV